MYDNLAIKYNILENGDVVNLARATLKHNRVLKKLGFSIMNTVKPPCEVFQEQSYRWKEDTAAYRMPDLSICCNPKSSNDVDIETVPWLIIEVLSESTKHVDETEKMNLYAKIGVQEYWIVDVFNESIIIYTIGKDGKYEQNHIYIDFDGAVNLKSVTKEAMSFEVTDLFKI